ncbi:MAG: hypothetical protein N5P05_001719 [Chroococcopsis gigantea SAG 12.99]|jgi:hypothetical protein|nr:hypothetical protein [Chlorogloea purpurea SAG 13.99]MDV3000113.1 hypothetical protein [Chroococcopsis gigantea SAG 12.99]
MTNFHQFRPRQSFLVGIISLVVMGWGLPSISSPKETSTEKVQLMFVQTAEDVKIDQATKTLRLVNVNQQTLYFSDRPNRIAGNLTMAAYMDEWKAGEGPDNFSSDPPNATISIYEPGRQDNTIAVIEISRPKIDGKDLVYKYKVIEGTLPEKGGTTALFIDWIGAGGGVGPGFHGVGAGARGVGYY